MNDITLKPCPKCGSKAFISRDTIHGFFMGYSVGCPRYCIGDGIHGVSSYEEHCERPYALHSFTTKQEAIEAWDRRATNEAD